MMSLLQKVGFLQYFLTEIKENPKAREHRWTVFVFNNFVDSFAEDHINIVKVNAKAWRRLI